MTKPLLLPLTAKFNDKGSESYRLVVGINAVPKTDDTPARTVMILADITYGGSSREIILDKPIDDLKSMIEEMQEASLEIDFSPYCEKPAQPQLKQKAQNGVVGFLRQLIPV